MFLSKLLENFVETVLVTTVEKLSPLTFDPKEGGSWVDLPDHNKGGSRVDIPGRSIEEKANPLRLK